MPVILNTSSPDFGISFAEFLASSREEANDVTDVATQIIADVRLRGDVALCDYTKRFDRLDVALDTLRVSHEEIETAAAACSKEVYAALEIAAARIADYHQRQLPKDELYTDETGMQLGWRWQAVESVGLYVPGGTAAYPSSVLMNAIPAKAAGVERMAMVVPTPDGVMNPAVMAAANIAGITEIYRIGGAQAIAALAYGTDSISPVDMIVGPGNAYVAAAKRLVFGQVGIDMVAGPSEILVIADNIQNPKWIAADLMSQAEHDVAAQSVLITDDANFVEAVQSEIQILLSELPRGNIASASWENHGAVILVEDVQRDAAALSNQIAPEHLEIATTHPEQLAAQCKRAGAIFLGSYTPEAVGDYIAGPSHVLPTSATARFSSGISVFTFLTRSSIIGGSPQSMQGIGAAAVTLAEAEGLQAHATSLALRLEESGE